MLLKSRVFERLKLFPDWEHNLGSGISRVKSFQLYTTDFVLKPELA